MMQMSSNIRYHLNFWLTEYNQLTLWYWCALILKSYSYFRNFIKILYFPIVNLTVLKLAHSEFLRQHFTLYTFYSARLNIHKYSLGFLLQMSVEYLSWCGLEWNEVYTNWISFLYRKWDAGTEQRQTNDDFKDNWIEDLFWERSRTYKINSYVLDLSSSSYIRGLVSQSKDWYFAFLD